MRQYDIAKLTYTPEMASTGVLPFIRGVDLSGNDFKVSGPGSVYLL